MPTTSPALRSPCALDIVGGVVRRARIGLGGVAATPMRALATEAALEGRPVDRRDGPQAAEVLAGEGTPIDDVRASAAYRAAMMRNALLRLAVERGGLEVRLPAAGRSAGDMSRLSDRPVGADRPEQPCPTRAPHCTSPARPCTPTT